MVSVIILLLFCILHDTTLMEEETNVIFLWSFHFSWNMICLSIALRKSFNCSVIPTRKKNGSWPNMDGNKIRQDEHDRMLFLAVSSIMKSWRIRKNQLAWHSSIILKNNICHVTHYGLYKNCRFMSNVKLVWFVLWDKSVSPWERKTKRLTTPNQTWKAILNLLYLSP